MVVSRKLKFGDPSPDSTTFEDAIVLTGHGRSQYEVLGICSLCMLSAGFENMLSSYVFSAAQCDLNIQPKDLGLFNVAFMIGSTTSAFLWGIVADLNGRKKVLAVTLLLNSLVTILCSLMQTFSGVLVCRFVNGFLICCPCSVSMSYLAEFHAPKKRSKSICYMCCFFTAAWVLLPMIAYFVLPLEIGSVGFGGVPFKSWRLFLVIIAVPEIVAGACVLYLPESPKFLHDRHDTEEALKVLRCMYVKNYGKDCEDYPVKKLRMETWKPSSERRMESGKVSRLVDEVFSQMKLLSQPPLRLSALLMNVITFSQMFGYFGLGLWLPEFFIRFQQEQDLRPNESLSVEDLHFTEKVSDMTCDTAFDDTIFRNTLIIGACALVGNIASSCLAGKVSTRIMAVVSMFSGSVSSACIYLTRSSRSVLAVTSIFQASMATANIVLGSVVVELFPSRVGAVTVSMTQCFGRIGAITSNVLLSTLISEHIAVVIFLASGVTSIGTLMCCAIPAKGSGSQKDKNADISKLEPEISVISISDSRNVVINRL